MKNKFYILLVSLLSVFAIVFVLRFVIGGDEDTWLCENGEWVKHGQPASDHPSSGCGENKLIGGDKDIHDCLIAAGYSWCSQKEKCLREWEEPCIQEKAFEVLTNLKKETNISFSGIGITSFKWVTNESQTNGKYEPIEKELNGKVFSAENVENKNLKKIDDFFKENSFRSDKYNVATGTYKSLTGYKRENMVCIITTTLTEYDPSNPEKILETTDTTTLKIECGEILE
ncbi:hypothetical protein KJ570_02190 [Patescibacteria group bacterium]|nr:hypothetical protein [Patescibacteria group bacterium]MBU2036323.1 hypothetical protein [Patescibacteria group bacterium]